MSRRAAQDEVAAVARRRLELLSAELAGLRPDPSRAPQDDLDPSATAAEPVPFDGAGVPGPGSTGRGPGAGPSSTWGSAAVPGSAPVPGPGSAPGSGSGSGETRGRHAHRPLGPRELLVGWVQDRLPSTLQGRISMTPAHLAIVAVVGVLGIALTLWWLARADGGSVAPLPPRPAAAVGALVTPASGAAVASAGPGSSPGPSAVGGGGMGGPAAGTAAGAPTGAASPTGRIVVDVAGKVRHPGIATLPAGSRVVDAVTAAGGARRGVRLAGLNLARVLTDGEQVVVGVPAPPGVAASDASAASAGDAGGSGSASAPPVVNLNTATQAELEALPGVGPVTARSILDYRAQQGRFSSVDQLLEVSGIGDATLAKIAPYCSL